MKRKRTLLLLEMTLLSSRTPEARAWFFCLIKTHTCYLKLVLSSLFASFVASLHFVSLFLISSFAIFTSFFSSPLSSLSRSFFALYLFLRLSPLSRSSLSFSSLFTSSSPLVLCVCSLSCVLVGESIQITNFTPGLGAKGPQEHRERGRVARERKNSKERRKR